MPLSDKISHLSSDEDKHPYLNEMNQSLLKTGLVVNTTYVKYKFIPNQNIDVNQISSQKVFPHIQMPSGLSSSVC